jgi:hypothetical protein
MSRCLGDKALLLLRDGEGTSAQRTHLTECEACVTRYRELGRDLEAINQVLREEPPWKTMREPSRSFTVRWLPNAAALALALVLMWIGVRLWSPSGRAPLKGTDSSEVWSLLDELRSNPFLLTDALAVELATEGAASYEAAAFLEAERPCEWYDLLATGEMESSVDNPDILASTPFRSCVEVEVKPLQKKP